MQDECRALTTELPPQEVFPLLSSYRFYFFITRTGTAVKTGFGGV
jgi:hypothetical protein